MLLKVSYCTVVECDHYRKWRTTTI